MLLETHFIPFLSPTSTHSFLPCCNSTFINSLRNSIAPVVGREEAWIGKFFGRAVQYDVQYMYVYFTCINMLHTKTAFRYSTIHFTGIVVGYKVYILKSEGKREIYKLFMDTRVTASGRKEERRERVEYVLRQHTRTVLTSFIEKRNRLDSRIVP